MPLFIGPEGRPKQETLTGWAELLSSQPTMTQKLQEADVSFKLRLQKAKSDHPVPCGNIDQPKLTRAEKRARRIEEIKHNKFETPQERDLEGPDGVHSIMQKRAGPLIELSSPIEVLVDEENRTYRKVHPRRNGWGQYRNQTREQLCNTVNNPSARRINSELAAAEEADRKSQQR